MQELLGIFSAFGLSTSAGLNAYIPLLCTGIMARMGWFKLDAPYDILQNPWVIGGISVLLVIELVVDKIPGADHVNDMIQTLIRPVAAAIAFAAAAGVITDVNPYLAMGIGLFLGGGVHATKAAVRPVVNLASFGTGAPVVSSIEDGVALMASVLAILVPVLSAIFVVLMIVIAVWMIRKIFARKRELVPPPVIAPAQA